jgi:hypothetical protein
MQYLSWLPRGETASLGCRPSRTQRCLQIFVAAKPSCRVVLVVAVAGPLLLGFCAAEAFGCPTCKDGVIASDDAASNIARGYFYSILLMLAMPFTLASCFGMYVWREYRRQQRAGVFDRMPDPSAAHVTDIGPRPGDSSDPVIHAAPQRAASSHDS